MKLRSLRIENLRLIESSEIEMSLAPASTAVLRNAVPRKRGGWGSFRQLATTLPDLLNPQSPRRCTLDPRRRGVLAPFRPTAVPPILRNLPQSRPARFRQLFLNQDIGTWTWKCTLHPLC